MAQYGGMEDGHELDETVYLLTGTRACTFCGSLLGPYSLPPCVPTDWRQPAAFDPDQPYGIAMISAVEHERFTAVTERVSRDRSAPTSGFWKNPSL